MKTWPLILIFFAINLNAQEIEWSTSNGEIPAGTQNYLMTQLLNGGDEDWKASENEIIKFDLEFSRSLLGSYVQSLYRVLKCRKRGRNCSYYYVQLIELSDEVVYFGLRDVDEEELDIKMVKDEFYDLVALHEEEFGVQVDAEHQYFNPTDLTIVGFACSAGGTAMPEFYEVEQLVRRRKKTEIVRWCHSLIPEIRCYGALGLEGLRRAGVRLNDEEMGLLEKISTEQTLVYYCSGCTGWGLTGFTVEAMYTIGKNML